MINANHESNQLHADGQSPTEFITSEYCGMDINCTPNEPYQKKFHEKAADPEP